MPINLFLSVLLPVIALAVQWVLWPWISPLIWFMFFPAVFFSARLGGFWGGMASTVLSTIIVWFFFVAPQLSLKLDDPPTVYSVFLFLGMGYLFSVSQERLRRSQKSVSAALADARAANTMVAELHRFRMLFDSSPDAYLIMEVDGGTISECNAATEAMLRGVKSQIIGKTPDQFSPLHQPDGRLSAEAAADRIKESIHTGQHRFEWMHQRLDGSEFWVEVTISALILDGRRVLLVAWRDIADRKCAERKLKDSEATYRALFEFSADALLTFDSEHGRFIDCNEAAVNLFSAGERTNLIGKTPEQLLPLHQPDGGSSPEIARKHIGQAIAEGSHSFEWRHCRLDGSEFQALVSLSMIGIMDQQHVLAIVRDISAQKRGEAVLLEAKLAAEASTRAKSAFVANMSHEIRTPMNAILGLAYLLEQTSLDANQRDYVQKTRISAQSLLGVLNDILDLSKVEAGRMELIAEPFRLDDLMKSLAIITGANARDKEIEVLFDIRPGTPLTLVGDSLRLQQVLTNLAANAIKFTERGVVLLSVEATATDAEGVDLLFSVRDTGIGIAPEHLQSIFDAFSQADGTTSRRFGGTGLGLAICRRLVELAGGRIWCESELGRGSTFHVAIRFGRSSGGVDGPILFQAIPRNLKVLVADDNPTARQVMAAMIAPFGWTVVVASSGQHALEEIDRAMENGEPFDLLLLDWLMPDVGGHDIVLHLKAHQPPEDIPLILVVTAFEYERVRRDSGDEPLIRAILTKPVTPSSLLDAVVMARPADTVTDTAALPISTLSAPGVPLAGMSLLVVEDNTINQMVARRILESAGASVAVAGDAIRALEVLSVGRDRFDAVLMDIQMPGMDGYDAARAIRNDLALVDLPIIAMTANAMSSDREHCLAAGMNDHIGKPFVVAQMTAVVARHVRSFRQLRTTKACPSGVPFASGPPALAECSEIDVTEALARAMGDHGLLKLVMAEFAGSYADTAASLARFLAEGTLPAAARAAHDLKGVAANLGAKSLSRAADALQKAAQSGNLEQANEACGGNPPTPSARHRRCAEGRGRANLIAPSCRCAPTLNIRRKRTVGHGGICIEEAIVPFVTITRTV